MKKLIGACAFLAGMLICSVSFAQDDTKMQTLVFDDDHIEGDLMMPDSGNTRVHELEELSSLIKAREDFSDEMLKTVDEL